MQSDTQRASLWYAQVVLGSLMSKIASDARSKLVERDGTGSH